MKNFLVLLGVTCLSACAAQTNGGGRDTTSASAPAAENALGRSQFLLCSACHSLSASAPATLGPHLEGIIGRASAALPNFAYSEMLRAENVVWTADLLERWLENPDIVAPNMCIPFNGIRDAQARKALIDYLDTAAP